MCSFQCGFTHPFALIILSPELNAFITSTSGKCGTNRWPTNVPNSIRMAYINQIQAFFDPNLLKRLFQLALLGVQNYYSQLPSDYSLRECEVTRPRLPEFVVDKTPKFQVGIRPRIKAWLVFHRLYRGLNKHHGKYVWGKATSEVIIMLNSWSILSFILGIWSICLECQPGFLEVRDDFISALSFWFFESLVSMVLLLCCSFIMLNWP